MQEARQKEANYFLPSPPTTNPPEPKVIWLLWRPNSRQANESKASHCSPPPKPEAITPPCPSEPEANQKSERKRKRYQEVEASQYLPQKRLRLDTNDNPPSTEININPPPTNINGSRPLADINGNQLNPQFGTWLQGGSYPAEYFDSGSQTWEDIKADTSARRLDAEKMAQPLVGKKKSAADLRRQALEANIVAPTETIDDKSVVYRSPGYAQDLELKGESYLFESPEGITEDDELLCQRLLNTVQTVPQDTLFRDDLFNVTCRKIQERNEARVVEDVSPLIAPSAETLATYGATELKDLVFNVNERWGESVSITETRPQPDRCVGFGASAFTWPQRSRLRQCIGHFVPVDFVSIFLATWRMYFPFFACEAKCGMGELDVADKQNAHSMTMAVRGIVELFKLVNREDELHRKILAFSISHDATIVRIHGHYALIKDRAAKFYRHPIHEFSFAAQNGKDKWTAYQFTKNVYFEFMPTLHALICSAIDQISLNQASQGSKPPQQAPLNDSFASTDLESEQPDSQDLALSAPGSQNSLGPKKRRLTGNAVLERQLDQRNEQVERLIQENERLKHSTNFGNDSEVVTMLRQQLQDSKEQRQEMKEQLEQQREEHKREMDEHKREMDEYKREMDELRDLLRQSLSTQSKGKGKN